MALRGPEIQFHEPEYRCTNVKIRSWKKYVSYHFRFHIYNSCLSFHSASKDFYKISCYRNSSNIPSSVTVKAGNPLWGPFQLFAVAKQDRNFALKRKFFFHASQGDPKLLLRFRFSHSRRFDGFFFGGEMMV